MWFGQVIHFGTSIVSAKPITFLQLRSGIQMALNSVFTTDMDTDTSTEYSRQAAT